MTGNELELMDSRLNCDPLNKIKSALSSYNFTPIKRSMLLEIASLFKSSKIIKPEHITGDFFAEVMPLNFNITGTELLY